tara:strand:- start:43 stop:417 length:375 start_codon:yes stop_codon:yes gene_type:complete
MNQSNELLNLFIVRNSAENLYKEVSSICDSADKDELLTMSVQELINLYPAKINACDSRLKLELVQTSLEREVEKSAEYTAFLENKISKSIDNKVFDPIKQLEDLKLTRPKSLIDQKIVSKEVVK